MIAERNFNPNALYSKERRTVSSDLSTHEQVEKKEGRETVETATTYFDQEERKTSPSDNHWLVVQSEKEKVVANVNGNPQKNTQYLPSIPEQNQETCCSSLCNCFNSIFSKVTEETPFSTHHKNKATKVTETKPTMRAEKDEQFGASSSRALQNSKKTHPQNAIAPKTDSNRDSLKNDQFNIREPQKIPVLNKKQSQPQKKNNIQGQSMSVLADDIISVKIYNSLSFEQLSQQQKRSIGQQSLISPMASGHFNPSSRQMSKDGSDKRPSQQSHCYFIRYLQSDNNKLMLANLNCSTQFKDLLFHNFAELIRYLSNNKNSLEYTARHYFEDGNADKGAESKFTSFKLQMEKGMPDFIPPEKDIEGYCKMLLVHGQRQVLNWLLCVVRGIVELQTLGIFHPDICLRNTIKVKSRNIDHSSSFKWIYKIIDFDYAFKVASSEKEQNKNLYNHTKLIVKRWLSAEQNKIEILNYLFRSIKKINFTPECYFHYYHNVIQLVEGKGTSMSVRVEKVMKCLHFYSLFYHKYQLQQICAFILDKQPGVKQRKIKEGLNRIPTQLFEENMKGYQDLVRTIEEVLQE